MNTKSAVLSAAIVTVLILAFIGLYSDGWLFTVSWAILHVAIGSIVMILIACFYVCVYALVEELRGLISKKFKKH